MMLRAFCRTLCCCLVLLGLLLPAHGHAEPQIVYLTFDDGPRTSTQDILDLLTQEEVPGTFFLIGAHVLISPYRQKTLQNLQSSPWAQVANHSFSHANEQYRVFYNNPEGMVQDFKKNNTILGLTTPPFPTRLPGRIDWRFEQFHTNSTYYPYNSKKAAPEGIAKLFDNHFVLYGWDVEWGRNKKTKNMDPAEHVAAEIKQRFLTNESVKPNKVVLLMHDQNFTGKEGMTRIQTLIQILRKEGYLFDFIKNYLTDIPPAAPQPK
ncbi:MAG: polysaccharide deacetylase family protein [Magnetococcales bacterium]|nr:polysaccharide deacetylase family protein [Magnetococcales bacterium]